LQRLPDNADTSIKMQPPTIRHNALNHHTVISDRMIFIPGQFKPQNSDNEANSKSGVIEGGGKGIYRAFGFNCGWESDLAALCRAAISAHENRAEFVIKQFRILA
jgi:hypothetical protein